jgi:hypothetical protein
MPQLLQAKDMASQPASSVGSIRTTTRKRKAPEDLSQNPNTVKARKRNEDLSKDPVRSQIEKAKAADQSAITVAKRKVKSSAEYLSASPARQQEMLQDSATSTKLKRYFQNIPTLIFILIWL